MRLQFAFLRGHDRPPTHLRVDGARSYRVEWVRKIRPASAEANSTAVVVDLDAYSAEYDETVSVSIVVESQSGDPARPDWRALQPSSAQASLSRPAPVQVSRKKPAPTAIPSNPRELAAEHRDAMTRVLEETWRRTNCIACGGRIVRSRDPHRLVGGTLSGSWFVYWPSGPDHLATTGPEPGDEPIFLFGVCHSECVDSVPTRLARGELELDRTLPELTLMDDTEAVTYDLHLPANGSVCPFCGGTGPMTDEHIWPKWLSRELATLGKTFAPRPGFRRPLSVIDFTVEICKQCNNEWLSTLENDVAAFVRPMLSGDFVHLALVQQEMLALWATKTAFLLDRASEPIVPRGYPMGLPIDGHPRSVQVFLGACSAGSWAAVSYFRPLRLAGSDGVRPQAPNGFVATFTAHKLVFQVVGHFTRSRMRLAEDRSGATETVEQIWPSSRTVSWPPKVILSDEGVEYLANRVAG